MDQVALLCSSFLHFLVYKYQFLLAPFDRINMYISHFFPISCIFILLLFHFEFISSPCVGRLGYYFPILPYYRRYYYPILRSPVIVVQQRPRLTNRNQATSITNACGESGGDAIGACDTFGRCGKGLSCIRPGNVCCKCASNKRYIGLCVNGLCPPKLSQTDPDIDACIVETESCCQNKQ